MKALRWLLVLLGAVFLIWPLAVTEARSFEFTDLTIDAWVQPDGAVRIVENRTAQFDGTFRGMFQWIDTSKDVEVQDVVVAENGAPYERNYGTDPGPAGTFFVREDPDSMYVDWSFEAADESRTFTLSYTITDAVVVHNDVAELYIQFVGDEWEASVNQVQVTLHLPNGGSEQLRAWGHGPLQGEVTVAGPATVVWKTSPLPAETFLEGRVTFPPDLVPEARRRSGQSALTSILSEEEQWASEANRKRTMAKADLAAGILAVVAAAVLALSWQLRWGREYRPQFTGEYQRELPQDYSPAVMSILYSFGTTGAKDLSSTLLDLARRGLVAIEAVEEGKRKPRNDYRITYRNHGDADNSTLRPHEQELLRFLFLDVDKEGDNSLTFQEIQAYARRKPNDFVQFWKGWQELVKEEAAAFDFFDETTAKKRNQQVIVGLIAVALSVVAFIARWLFAGVGLVIAALMLLIGSVWLRRRSQNGCTEFAQWKAFRRFLLHFSEMQRHEVGSLVIWEHYLVYAVSLGVAKEALKQLRLVFPDLQQDGRRFGYGWYHYAALSQADAFESSLSSLTSSIESSFQQAISAAASKSSSGSGSGGGFSGGGGGGVGGGGGGVR